MSSISPELLRERLFADFPEFEEHWYDEDNPISDALWFSHHGLLIEFAAFFDMAHANLRREQLRGLAGLVNEAVAGSGEIADAAAFMLELLRDVGAYEKLEPLLSDAAKEKSHA